ncbi:MAG: FGGY-family carbohydrate kinase [Aestuariivirgaceae bacterium]|nr:FGGY-family carbohydrate kinase [Aestuariivirgaceae bacterium]
MREAVLGIDVGTSGVRIVAAGRGNQVLASAATAMPAPVVEGRRKRQHPQIWLRALHEAFAALDLTGLHIRALAINGTSGTILPVDGDGQPMAAASMYDDVAQEEHVAAITAVAPQETAARGGTSPLARAIPMQANSSRILHQADWLAAQFSGDFSVTDENNALKSGYDPLLREWPAWMERAGFETKLLPRVVAAGEPTGTISVKAAHQFGLPEDVVIVAGTTDGCAAFLASGAREVGDGVTSLGTTLTLKLLSAKPVFAPAYGIYSHRIGKMWLAGGASNTGGGALRALFSDDEIKTYSEMLKPDEPTGLDYYPLAQPGERFPVNDPGLAPRLSPRPQSGNMFFQGVLESIATIEALGYARLAELGASKLASIRSLGGGAANRGWTQIRLARLGVPEADVLDDQAALGTARLAWWGIGHAD